MSIKIIKEKINDLKKSLPPQPEDISNLQFKDAIILKYVQHVINRLDDILREDFRDDVILTENFKCFLENNWELVKGNLLAYAALPTHPITQLLCDVAEYVAENRQSAAINFLMPGIACDSLSLEKYGNLDEMDLTEVLRTYVLGKDCTYLIPISILAKEEIDLAIRNPYFDLYIHDKNSEYLAKEELNRLAEHSSETTALYTLRNDYVALSNDKLNLLGKLKEFIRGLGFYGVKGIGEEEVVGDGGYALVINFIEFWNTLNKKDAIPDAVKKEIEIMVQMSTDKDKNKNEPMEGCFATRRTELFAAMKANRKILGEIILSPEKKESGIKKTIEGFDMASAALQQRLKCKAYTGQDRLGITAKILDVLGVELSFANFSALTASLKGLRAEDVSALCALQQAPEKIVSAIGNVENLVILASVELSDEVLSALLQGIKDKLNLIIKSPKDFSGFLIPLNINQCELICAVLKAELTAIIKNGVDFSNVLCSLEPESCTVVYEALEKILPAIIKTSKDFSNALCFLNLDQRTAVYDALEKKLSAMIENGRDFSSALLYLNPNQRTAVYETLKGKLTAIIDNTYSLADVLKHLDPAQCGAVCEALERKLSAIIKNGIDLADVIHNLNPDQCKAICEALKEKVTTIIKDGKGLADVLQHLMLDKCKAVCEALEAKLTVIIKNEEDLKAACGGLNSAKALVVRTAYANAPKETSSSYAKSLVGLVGRGLGMFNNAPIANHNRHTRPDEATSTEEPSRAVR